MKKRILSSILVVAMIVALFPAQVFAVEADEMPSSSIVLPIIQEGDDFPEPQGFGADGGVATFSLTPNNPKYVYGYEGVNELRLWNSKIYIAETENKPTENGLLQILDSNGVVLASSDAISDYYQDWDSDKNEYSGPYYISSATFKGIKAITEGVYELRLVAGNNESYSCDTSLCIVGEGTLLLTSASIQNLYSGKDGFEVYLKMYGFEKETDLDSFSMKLLDSNNDTIAQSTGNYRDLNRYNGSWSFYGEMKVLQGKTIENNEEYSLQMSFTGTAIMVDGVGAVTQSAYAPNASISSVKVEDPSKGILSVALEDCKENTTYQIAVTDDSSYAWYFEDLESATIYGSWEWANNTASNQIEVPLFINGMSVSMKNYPQRLQVMLFEVNSSKYNRYIDKLEYDNPYYDSNSGNQYIRFDPYYVKPTAKNIPFVIRCDNGCSYYKGNGDVVTICDQSGNEVGRCNAVTRVDGDYASSFELKGTISISGVITEKRAYNVLLNGYEIDTIYVTRELRSWSSSITGAYSQEIQGYCAWTNLGTMSVSADVINSSGSGRFEIRNEAGSLVLTSTSMSGTTSEYYDHHYFAFNFPANEVMGLLSDGATYSIYFKDNNGSEISLRDVIFKGDKVTFDLTNSEHCYFQGGRHYAGTQEVEVVLYGDIQSFRNVSWEEVETELKKVFLSLENGENVSVSSVTRQAGNRSVYLQLSKPLSVGEYSVYYNGAKIKTYTVEKAVTSQPPQIYSYNGVGADCTIHGSYLPTTSTYTARIFKGYTCVAETFSLTLSGENNGNTQYLRFAKSTIDNLEAGEYKIRLYMDGKVLGEVDLSVTTGDLVIIEAYDANRGYRNNLGMANAIIESGYVAFQIESENYTYYRFSEDQTKLENEYYYRISAGYRDQLSEGAGEKTLYIQLKDSAGVESEVYEVKVWQTNGDKLDIYVDESIQGIYSENSITLTVGADCPYTNAYVEFVESDGNTSVAPLTYKEQGQLGGKLRYIFSTTFSVSTYSWNHPNKNNAMVRFYLATDKYSSEYLSEVVERVLIFGDPTYIIMPQFSQYGELTTNKSSYQIYGYATPNSTVNATVNGTSYTATANDRGYFTVDLASLTTGEYKISLRDSNNVASQRQYTLTVDTTPPTVKNAGFTFNADGVSAVLRWTCEDQDIERFEIYKNSTRLGTIYSKSDSGNYVYSVTAHADDGNCFTIKAVDQAGNESSSTISTADTEPPTAPSSAPQLVSKTTTTVTLSWGAGSDNMGVAGYNIYNGEEKLAETSGEATTYTLTGLMQGQEYDLAVKTRDRAGLLSDASTPLTISTVALSFAQDNLDNTYIVDIYNDTKRIPVSAQVSADEQDYEVTLASAEIEFRMQGTETWTNHTLQCSNNTVSGSWNISGSGADGFLPVGNYEVRFRATDTNGAVVVSSPVKVVLLKVDDEAPTAPGTPVADSHNTTEITFHWDAATDNVAVDHYDIYRDDVKVGTSKTLSYTDTGLEIGHGYNYTVRAIDKRGNTSVSSSAATLSTMDLQFDSVITFASSYVMEEQANKGIAVWAKFKPEEGYAPAVTMSVEYKLSTASTWSSSDLTVDQSNKNRFTGQLPISGSETGYLPAGNYSIRFAVTDGSATAYSDTQTVSLQRDTTPPVVSSLTPGSGTFGGKEIRLSVSATDNVGVDRIVLAYAPKGGSSYVEITSLDNVNDGKSFSSSYTWDASDLISGEYTIKATAYDIRNNAGELERTITIDNTPPAVPTGLTVTGTSRYIYVVWDKYTAPSDFSAFKVYRADKENGDYTCVSTISTIGYYDDGESATAGITYFYYVTAIDKYGNESEPTQIGSASFVTDTESPRISDFRPTENSTLCKEAALSVMATDNYRLSKAVFEYRVAGSGSWQEIAVVEVPSVTNNTVFRHTWNLTGLVTGTYEVRVSVYDDSVNAVVEGKYEANAPAVLTRTVQVRQYTAPVAPQVVATSGYKTVSLNWTYGGDESLLSTYIVYRATTENGNFAPVKRLSPTVTSYQDSIPINATYYYKVVALDRFDASAESAVHSASSVGTDTQAPTAVIIPENLLSAVGVPFRFSGVNSSDNDAIKSYHWDFGDGSASSNEIAPFHQYSSEGTFAVKLTVTDECGNSNTATATITVVDVSKPNAEYTLVTFHVVDAGQSNTPAIKNAILLVSPENGDGMDYTLETESDGTASALLPRGKHTVSVTADSYLPSTKTLQVTDGENGRLEVTVGLSSTSLVSGKLTSKEMTYGEIVAAGIDVTAPENQHVWKFETQLHFSVGLKTFDVPFTVGYKNSAGQFTNCAGGWYTIGGGTGIGSGGGFNIGIFPMMWEGFYLIIYGEAHWLKEMYNVELLVINESNVDVIEKCVADLVLPDGLSLATMLGQQQTATIDMGSIAENGEKTARWYVCGDKEGEYYLTANVQGNLVSGNVSEPFFHTFETDKPLKVYAGSALKLTITADDYAERGKPYNVTFRLTNFSDKSLYNLSFGITGVEQGKILSMIKNDGLTTVDLPIDHADFNDSLMKQVNELAPGGYLEVKMSTTCWFNSAAEILEAAAKIAAKKNVFTAYFGEFIDVVYYLDQVNVVTLEGSTTTIPYEVVINPVKRENIIIKGINVLGDTIIGEFLPPEWKKYLGSPVQVAGGVFEMDSTVMTGTKTLLGFAQGETDYTFDISIDDGRCTETSIENDYISITMGEGAEGLIDFLNSPGIKLKTGEISIEYKAPGSTRFKIGVKNDLEELETEYIVQVTTTENTLKETLSVSMIGAGIENEFKLNEDELKVALGHKRDKDRDEYMRDPFQIFESELEFSLEGQNDNTNYSVSLSGNDFSSIVNGSYTTKLTYNGQTAKISFDREALETIAELASSQTNNDVVVAAKRLSDTEAESIGNGRPTYQLSVVADGENISDFGEGQVLVCFPFDLEEGHQVAIQHIKEDGTEEYIVGTYNAIKKQVEFVTDSFSYFVICELDGDILEVNPTISGSATVPGQVLTAEVEGVPDSELVYRWYRGDDFTAPIAISKSYALTYADSNTILTVRVSGSENGIYDSSIYTETEIKVQKFEIQGTVSVKLSVDQGNDGIISVGDTLSATVLPDVAATYQWKNNGEPISGATASTYVVTEGNQLITVTVTPSENYTGTLTSTAVEVGKRILAGTVTVDGTAAVGRKLTVEISVGDATGEDYTITWLRDDEPIPAASDTSYLITKDDQGKTITVKIAAKGDRYTGEIISSGIAIPATVPDAPVVSVSAGNGQTIVFWTVPYNNGSPITGYTLQANDLTPVSLRNDVTSYTVTGLANGTEYIFKVTAINVIGASIAGQAKAIPKAPPSTPSSGGGGGGVGGGGGSSSSTIFVSIPSKVENGKVTVDKKNPHKGEAVTITVKPDSGYQISSVTVTDSKGTEVAIKDLGGGMYAFVMPATEVKINAQFVEIVQQAKPSEDNNKIRVTDRFQDIRDTDWYVGAVQYVYDNNLMIGINEDTFAPNLPTSRCMFVTILYRLEKEPETSVAQFTDVSSGKYYSDAVAWAAEKGIVNGYGDGTFRPNSPLTREQLATILYRYASMKGYDISQSADLNRFSDANLIRSYALDALQWANAMGIINGTDWGGLYPRGDAIRAEVAAVLERFMGIERN